MINIQRNNQKFDDKSTYYLIILIICLQISFSIQEADKNISNSNNNNNKLSASSSDQKLSSNQQNPLLDAATAMFHHVENTKTCGANLEKLKINLEPLWLYKFENQIKKTLKLTNSLNHLINNLNDDSSKHNHKHQHNINLNQNSSTLINFHIIESHMLSSLNYFMFSNGNNLKDFDNSLPYSNDPYIKGYGVVLFENDDDQIENYKCLFINNENPNLRNKSCSALNLVVDPSSESQQSQTQDDLVFNNKMYSNGNDINSADDSSKNGRNWLKRLKQAYQEFFASQAKLYNNNVYKTINYPTYLDMFLKSSMNFTKSLWCGPYYDCTSSSLINFVSNSNVKNNIQQNQNDWILLYTLPLFGQDKQIRGAVLVKLVLTKMDINQCKNGDPVFANTHKCKVNSECVFIPKSTFTSGNYRCKCKSGFINSNRTFTSYDGKILENQYWLMKSMKNNSYNNDFNCIQCVGRECCNDNNDWSLFEKSLSLSTIEDEEIVREYTDSNIFWNCRRYNMTLRTIIFIVQIVFIIITISIAVVIFCFRQNKVTFYFV
jgi:hypothetical protein